MMNVWAVLGLAVAALLVPGVQIVGLGGGVAVQHLTQGTELLGHQRPLAKLLVEPLPSEEEEHARH